MKASNRKLVMFNAGWTFGAMLTAVKSQPQREDTSMHITNHAFGFGVVTVLGLCAAAPVSAAPVLSNTAALKSAADNSVTEVRWGIRRGVVRAAVATGVGLAVAGAARSYAYGYGYPYGYQSYNYGYPSSYGYAGYSTSYAPYSYNYGYGGYSYNYGYSPGYYGYGVRRAARGVARRAYYRR
jgi:hypothetical protein